MVSTSEVVVENAPVDNLPKSTDNPNEDNFDSAQKKFQQGKKYLLLNKYDEAVNNIGDACKLYAIKYGELAPECAEIYFYYGKALLELARVENTVLGNALNGVPEDTGPIDDSRYGNPDDVNAEEKEKISEEVIDAMCEPEKAAETAENKAANQEETNTNGEAVTTEVKPASTETPIEEIKKPENETTTSTEASNTNGTAAANAEGEEDEEGDEEGDEEVDGEEEEDLTKNDEQAKADETEAEDISNLQRAWEMFELAKLVYGKNFDNDQAFKSKRTAECLLKLGEIGIEQELYEQAIGDIKESIRFHEEAKERDERMLAESFYQLGLAFQFNEQFQDAGESYQKSINILQLRIDKLKILIEQTNDEFEKTTLKDEISELETILPEMVSKLEEINEQGQQSLKLIKEAKECFLNKIDGEENRLNGGSSASAEVKDITSLVKSKRKISSSQIAENTDTAIKKTKIEDETTEPTTNGTTAEMEQQETNVVETPTTTTAAPAEASV